ncbi:hypothetical protein DRJ04_09900 [Candidatus Aerophobetes bacterium]|uniref:Uncharacterized protein n=1 Tax=Aerophobetes bacterium TaxID=2030807 RepID=A0A662D491_UNCAE|nr:MAG: hypothetical protein DRJ04_09900 [Candidatus Aerophobetes bacterium]
MFKNLIRKNKTMSEISPERTRLVRELYKNLDLAQKYHRDFCEYKSVNLEYTIGEPLYANKIRRTVNQTSKILENLGLKD